MNHFERAKKELQYAHENVRFIAGHFQKSGLSINDIRTPEDFRRIPMTEKKHYRKNFPAGVLAKGFKLSDRGLYRTQSSGTTGERMITLEIGLLYFRRAVECFSVNPSLLPFFTVNPRRHCRYAAPNCSDVECALPNSRMTDRILEDGTLVLSVSHDLLTTPAEILKKNIQEILTYQPRLYYVDPTHLAHLSRYMKKVGYTPVPAPIFASYTHCTKISKRQIQEVFGEDIPLVRFVSMSEFGWLALECPRGNLHLNTNSCYQELLAGGKPAQPGELAELCVTTLDNGCMPFIRYRTRDIYRYLGNGCNCGHHFPMVRFEGRSNNFIFRNNTIRLTPGELDDLIGDPPWMNLYKLEQTGEADFLFRYIPNEKYQQGMETYIRDELHRRLWDICLEMEKTDYIPTERSGKFLSCTSVLGEREVSQGFSV